MKMKKILNIALLLLALCLSTKTQSQDLIYNKIVGPYADRVRYDLGTTKDIYLTRQVARLNEPYSKNLLLSVNSFSGQKLRTSGIYNYVSKAYDMAPHQAVYGGELVTNGGFASDTGWTIVGASTISGGVANILSTDGSLSSITIACSKVIGKVYQLEFDFIGTSSGNLQVSNTASVEYTFPNGSSGHAKVLITGGEAGALTFKRNGVCNITIDNVSLREVLINDLTQTTALSQPYSVKIAPNEVNAFVNGNGESKYLTHPAISFGATDKWTAEWVLNWNGVNSDNAAYCFLSSTTYVRIKSDNLNRFNIYTSVGGSLTNINFTSSNTAALVGKTFVVTFTYNSGQISLYINGVFVQTVSANITNITFNSLFSPSSFYFYGKIYSEHIFNTSLPSSEIARRASVIKSIIPDVESVVIGTQRWTTSNFSAVTTCMGNPIQEVQDNSNVEKITNGGFDTDTGWTKSNSTISGGLANITANGGYVEQTITANKWYKATFTINGYTSGNAGISIGTTSGGFYPNANGTFTTYFLANGTIPDKFRLASSTSGVTFDNASCQQVGWSDATNMYNGLITQGYTAYNATKACAFWSHYSNDPVNGATYGKLYNWFAVKLLSMDIGYYNAANPTTPFGYHAPSNAEQQTPKCLCLTKSYILYSL
jgi:hypothetical protein